MIRVSEGEIQTECEDEQVQKVSRKSVCLNGTAPMVRVMSS
jgi:hypothetical protein